MTNSSNTKDSQGRIRKAQLAAKLKATKSLPEVSCCGWPLDDDGFCHGCWEHCL